MSSRIQSRNEWKGTIGVTNRSQDVLLSIVDIVGRKWYPVILYHLHTHGSTRFSELKDDIDDISSKMLSDSLERLENEHELIDRTVVDDNPLCVEYSLTDRGKSIGPLIAALHEWGVEHLLADTAASSTESSGRTE